MKDTLTEDAMPGGKHPALAHLDYDFFPKREHYVQMPKASSPSVASFDDKTLIDVAFPVHTFQRRKVAAPVPYVGRVPLWLMWWTWQDEAGRCVSAPPEDAEYRYDEGLMLISGQVPPDSARR